MESLLQQIQELPLLMKYLSVFLLSMVPIIEQRGAIPLGFALGLDPAGIFFASLLGSYVPVPFILWAFNAIYAWMGKFKVFSGIIRFLDNKIRKNTPKIEKYKEVGLILFVAFRFPQPVCGPAAWWRPSWASVSGNPSAVPPSAASCPPLPSRR